jgi:capsular exopolysaccharide synthesis family protein
MDLRKALAALRAGWFLPVFGMIFGGVVAAAAASVMTPYYTSSTQLFVSTADATSTAAAYQGSQFSENRVSSYVQVLTSERLADRVVEAMGIDMSASELQEAIDARVVPDTVVLDVQVTDTSPQRARALAAAIDDEFTAMVAELEAPIAANVSPSTPPASGAPVKVTVLASPQIPASPSSPSLYMNIGLGLLIGLVAGLAAALARVHLDRSVRDEEEATTLAGAPLIGVILRDDALAKQHALERNSPSRTAEEYRQLRTNLQFLSVDEPPKVIMVSSAVPSEGKTTVVVNLALALVDSGRRVAIVEADLRKPKVTRYLGMVGGAGLTNILAGTAEASEVMQAYGSGDLNVIAAGPTPPNPGELLSSSHMLALIEKLRGENDFVLVDAPPLLPVADSSALAVIMDGVLLSVRYGSTTKDQLRQAALNLERVGAKTLGLILNIVPPKADLASAYGYGYEERSPQHR